MAIEIPFLPRADAERVRGKIAKTAERALDKLAAELLLFTGGKKNTVTETWVKNFAKVADQLRRDYRIEPLAPEEPAEQSPSAAPADPLARLKLLLN